MTGTPDAECADRYKAALRRIQSQLDRPCHDGISDVLAQSLVAYIGNVLGDEKPAEAGSVDHGNGAA